MKPYKQVIKYGAQIGSVVGAGLFTMQAHAVSLMPAGVLTSVTTDVVDTVEDLAVQGLPLVTGIALAWFIVSGVKTLLAKGGVR